MPERDPGQGFELEVLERGALRLGEAPNLRLCKRDVLSQARAGCFRRAADLVTVDDERRRVPSVELPRVVPDRALPVALDAQQHLADGAAHLVGPGSHGPGRLLQILHGPPFISR